MAHFLMTDAARFDVAYRINPWMKPQEWAANRAHWQDRARLASAALREALAAAGARVDVIPAEPGLPDLVFPANAAVVLDGKALMARFLFAERRGEEPVLLDYFERLAARGLIEEIVEFPEGLFHEGAGDAIWDARRGHFWAVYGQRSSYDAVAFLEQAFEKPAVRLELASPRFYHLDTCFCPLSGGEVLYYPTAFTPEGVATIHANVAPELRIEASDEEAAAFCVNAVNIGRRIIMAQAPASLRETLTARGYQLTEIDLDPFILSGGAAYCMTLRLDRTSAPVALVAAEQMS
jgi:N-dimethylarginine dimethylaminohydrolase